MNYINNVIKVELKYLNNVIKLLKSVNKNKLNEIEIINYDKTFKKFIKDKSILLKKRKVYLENYKVNKNELNYIHFIASIPINDTILILNQSEWDLFKKYNLNNIKRILHTPKIFKI